MRDTLGREITYLRISLTDRCNLRCVYCMPPEGVNKREHRAILSLEEMEEIAREAAALGVRKIRLTGGEPLVRRGILSLCRRLRDIPQLEELTLTTNGVLLPGMAAELKAAGVDRVNISLDTLDPEKYRCVTRMGTLEDTLAGIRAAGEAGLTPLKLNCVLIGGFNDDEIPALAALTAREPVEVRFIELMPIGRAAPFGPEAYLPCEAVLERLPDAGGNRRRGGAVPAAGGCGDRGADPAPERLLLRAVRPHPADSGRLSEALPPLPRGDSPPGAPRSGSAPGAGPGHPPQASAARGALRPGALGGGAGYEPDRRIEETSGYAVSDIPACHTSPSLRESARGNCSLTAP